MSLTPAMLTYAPPVGPNVVEITASGPTSVLEYEGCVRRLLTDPGLPRDLALLVDVTTVGGSFLWPDAALLPALARGLAAKGVRRIAILTSRVGHAAIAALIAEYASSAALPCRSFTARETAWEWLTSPEGT